MKVPWFYKQLCDFIFFHCLTEKQLFEIDSIHFLNTQYFSLHFFYFCVSSYISSVTPSEPDQWLELNRVVKQINMGLELTLHPKQVRLPHLSSLFPLTPSHPFLSSLSHSLSSPNSRRTLPRPSSRRCSSICRSRSLASITLKRLSTSPPTSSKSENNVNY